MNIFDLPELIDGDRADELINDEIRILDLTDTLIDQGDESLLIHRNAITLCEELLACHESGDQPDEIPHYCAEQLKLHHLDALARLLEIMPEAAGL